MLETNSSLYTNLVMRQDQYPGKSPDFALALKYLFDRETIKRAIFRGSEEAALHHPHYDFNDDILPIGIRLHAALVERRYVRAIHG